MSELFLTPADLARLLGVTRARIYQLIAQGEVPWVFVGGRYRVPRAAWDAWLEEKSAAALRQAKHRPGRAAASR